MGEMIKILCVDDERNVLKSLKRLFLDEDDYEIFLAESGRDGLEILEAEKNIRLVISDYRMPEMNGVEFLSTVCERWPETIRIVLSGYADTAAVVEAINLGQIYKFIPKPWNDEELKTTIFKALEHQDLQRQVFLLNEELNQKNLELEQINEELERLVKKRTESLVIHNRVLQVAQGVLDVLPVAVFGIDNDRIIVQCNDSARSMFSAKIMDPLGYPYREIFPEEMSRLLDDRKSEALSSGLVEIAGKEYLAELTRLNEKISQGIVLTLIPHRDLKTGSSA